MDKDKKVFNRTIKDFYRGVKISFGVLVISVLAFVYFPFILTDKVIMGENELASIRASIITIGTALSLILSIRAFFINYTTLKVKEGKVVVPAQDQIRTFTDLLILNPITGYFRTRSYNANEIETIANGYTRSDLKKKSRDWNVVITGTNNGNSFSQRIDCSNKQVRDELRNVLKQAISGKADSEFSY